MSDHGHHEPALPAELPKFASSMGAVGAAAAVGVIGLIVAFATAGGMPRFWASYLLGFMYWMTVALGAMFMLLTFHASAARWVTGFRRIMEVSAQGVWLQGVLALIFVFFGAGSVYKWRNAAVWNKVLDELREEHAVLGFKTWWLNAGTFTVRSVIYVVAFAVTVWLLNSWSRAQDTSNDPGYFTKLVRLGSGGVPILGLIGTAMSFDWLMSLDPDWASTIYGAYVLAGGYLAALALTAFLAHGRRDNVLRGVVGVFEYHNLGKLLFALVCFWAYLGYAQYMLMWIANMPEEIRWWLLRFEGEWRVFFWLLVFLHFIVPFLALLRKVAKLHSRWVMAVAVLILVNHFIDLSFLIIPSDSVHGTLQLSDVAAVLGVGGLHLAFVLWRMNGVVVAPRHDPNFGAPVAVH